MHPFSDYRSYVNCQEEVSQGYMDGENWTPELKEIRYGKWEGKSADYVN
jgi:hypothetical protein